MIMRSREEEPEEKEGDKRGRRGAVETNNDSGNGRKTKKKR